MPWSSCNFQGFRTLLKAKWVAGLVDCCASMIEIHVHFTSTDGLDGANSCPANE